MNASFLTQAADGLPRRGFTNRDVARMVEAGILDPDEAFELIAGEIVPMSPEFDRHFRARSKLTKIFARALSDEWLIGTEGSLYLAENVELKPDLHIFPSRIKSEDVRGLDVALVVELSSTTQRRDLELKAPIYLSHGVRELWVLDLDARTGHLFRAPATGLPHLRSSVTATETFSPEAFEAVRLSIADLVP